MHSFSYVENQHKEIHDSHTAKKVTFRFFHEYKILLTCGSFPGSSAGKESTCNAGDPGSIPGSGISAGEGIDYPLQCSWASLVTQMVRNLPAMWENWV